MALHQVVLLMGSNLGDRSAILTSACARITTLIGAITLTSGEYTSAPDGVFAPRAEGAGSYSFLNQALSVATNLAPESVLDAIEKIECELGRSNHASDYTATGERLYHDRTIDIDVLFYDNEVIATKRLTVPHPRLHERRFALEPVTEIMPEYSHPILKIRLKELFNLLLLGDSQ